MRTVFFILAAISLWMVFLSFFVIVIYRFFKKLSPNLEQKDLLALLEEILNKEKVNSEQIKVINEKIESIQEGDTLHLQKVGFIRFNPFEELGGDHSFSVALLDGKDTGIIITGLHTRERTRVYVKVVREGESEVELSREEKKALRTAQKNN